MNNYVLVTYFTINNKFIFVQRCLKGNLFVTIFLMWSQYQNGMLYNIPLLNDIYFMKYEKYTLHHLLDSSISVTLACLGL